MFGHVSPKLRYIFNMASSACPAKRAKSSKTYNLEEVLALLEDDSDIAEADRGISSSEESELNHDLENLSDDSR